ncbi:MAG TPA: class I SAM-dependent methyltransferase [Streptosporangiaceae bacterium]|nr:class I SAM-dependent methyltransferase [Streptosporangiaceae bacterium]
MTDLRTPPVNDGDLFSERVRQYSYEKPLRQLVILLAGCGGTYGFDPDTFSSHVERHVTGIDVDTPVLRARTEDRGDLDSWHLGDLRTVPLPPRTFHVVCVPFLIERIPHAELTLDRFIAALKPGGLLLVRFRDRDTAFGFVERLIPGPLRRHLLGESAPSVYEPIASYKGIHLYCVMRGLMVAEEYVSRDTVAHHGPWSGLLTAAARLVAACTGGRLPADHSEVTFVIRKPENRFARLL